MRLDVCGGGPREELAVGEERRIGLQTVWCRWMFVMYGNFLGKSRGQKDLNLSVRQPDDSA